MFVRSSSHADFHPDIYHPAHPPAGLVWGTARAHIAALFALFAAVFFAVAGAGDSWLVGTGGSHAATAGGSSATIDGTVYYFTDNAICQGACVEVRAAGEVSKGCLFASMIVLLVALLVLEVPRYVLGAGQPAPAISFALMNLGTIPVVLYGVISFSMALKIAATSSASETSSAPPVIGKKGPILPSSSSSAAPAGIDFSDFGSTALGPHSWCVVVAMVCAVIALVLALAEAHYSAMPKHLVLRTPRGAPSRRNSAGNVPALAEGSGRKEAPSALL